MPIDERHQRRWRAEQARRQMVRDDSHLLHTFSPRAGENEETDRLRLSRQDNMHAVEMDAREDVANDDDMMPGD